ncbi:MAG: VirB8/TrbF family protein, partial [Burkholderiales bacterium]
RDAQARPVEEPYIATVRFHYSARQLSNEDRILNPLNFRATAYRADREIALPQPTRMEGGTK